MKSPSFREGGNPSRASKLATKTNSTIITLNSTSKPQALSPQAPSAHPTPSILRGERGDPF